MVPRTSEGSRADNLNIGLLFVLDAHTSQREVCEFELPFETSGDNLPRRAAASWAAVTFDECVSRSAD